MSAPASRTRPWLASAAGLLAAPLPGLACSVCYGDPAGPMTQGMNMGILTLLGVTLGVLGGFVWFFVSLARKSAAVQTLVEATDEWRRREGRSAPHLGPAEAPVLIGKPR